MTVAGYYRKREHQLTMVPLVASSWGEDDEAEESLALSSRRPKTDPVYQAEVREEWEEVVQAINLLTEEQRQVLISRLILGYDIATVARMLGKKANAIKALQFRALQRLYRLLGRDTASHQNLDAHIRRQEGAS
jgi:RNA polymerase sigma-70 factor (ECF subfamily)